jgi:hypothetical protein
MRSSHRSASYQFDVPTLEVSESEILHPQTVGGWQCHTVVSASPCLNLNPEGAAKNLGSKDSGIKNLGVADSHAHQSQPLRSLDRFELPAQGHALNILQEVGRIHAVNIQRSLSHRVEMAKQQGDQRLLRALESESRAIAQL